MKLEEGKTYIEWLYEKDLLNFVTKQKIDNDGR